VFYHVPRGALERLCSPETPGRRRATCRRGAARCLRLYRAVRRGGPPSRRRAPAVAPRRGVGGPAALRGTARRTGPLARASGGGGGGRGGGAPAGAPPPPRREKSLALPTRRGAALPARPGAGGPAASWRGHGRARASPVRAGTPAPPDRAVGRARRRGGGAPMSTAPAGGARRSAAPRGGATAVDGVAAQGRPPLPRQNVWQGCGWQGAAGRGPAGGSAATAATRACKRLGRPACAVCRWRRHRLSAARGRGGEGWTQRDSRSCSVHARTAVLKVCRICVPQLLREAPPEQRCAARIK